MNHCLECDRPSFARGYCNSHYKARWKRGEFAGQRNPRLKVLTPGDTYGAWTVLDAEPVLSRGQTTWFCRCAECGQAKWVQARNLLNGQSTRCNACRLRAKMVDPSTPCRYAAAHHRVQRLHGFAREHVCACGAPAQTWAYQHNDPNELVEDVRFRTGERKPVAYSPDPQYFEAMCYSCHARFDIAHARRLRA